MSGFASSGNKGNDRRFFFMHLMKTGGTSFAFQLRKHFDNSEVFPCQGIDSRDLTDVAVYASVRRLLRTSPERRADIRVYTGHFPFIASQMLDPDLVTLTLLRDPVDRTISLLKHFKRLSKHFAPMPVEEIYEDPFVFAQFVENHQTRMFAVTETDNLDAFGSANDYWGTAALLGFNPGVSEDNQAPGVVDLDRAIAAAKEVTIDEQRFETAKQHLEMVDVVGLNEHYDAFIDELRRRFGWWPSGLNTAGRANRSDEAWGAPDALRIRIAEDNRFDMELYEHAHQIAAQPRPRASTAKATPAAKVAPARKAETNDRPRKASAPPVPVEHGRNRLRAEVRAKHPRFLEALRADAKTALTCRSERRRFRGRVDAAMQIVRLMCVSDAFLAQVCYRAKARLQALGVPMLPRVFHRLAIMIAQVNIGDPVVIRPGVYIAHGQTVIDGFTEIRRGVIIAPWTTIGPVAGNHRGPIIGRNVQIGTGAKVLGPVVVHRGARIGANAVVVRDVPANTTVLGPPVRHVPPVATP